jgi:hypothetical protein
MPTSGPIVRTGPTPEFWKNYDSIFGSKKKSTSSAAKPPKKKAAAAKSSKSSGAKKAKAKGKK